MFEGALFLEDYCWEHLPLENKVAYKQKIETWLKNGYSLEGANLRMADLQNADLFEADLKEACLNFTNLKEAFLLAANLKDAFMVGALIDGVKHLTWEQVKQLGEEKKRWWEVAKEGYLSLKNYFHQQGRYGDEAQAYYREKLMAKHEGHEKLFGRRLCRVSFKTARKSWNRFYVWFIKGFKRAFQNIGRFFKHNENKGVRRRWFGLWFMWALAGFGERWSRTVSWAAGTFAFFGLLHWMGTNTGAWVLKSNGGGVVKNLLDCLYFSLVTFVTLGFGDIWPVSWLPKVIVGVEVVFGYVFLGLLVTLIARKMGR